MSYSSSASSSPRNRTRLQKKKRHYYVTTNENIAGALSCKNLLSSHVKRSPLIIIIIIIIIIILNYPLPLWSFLGIMKQLSTWNIIWLRISTGRRRTSWLFTSMAKIWTWDYKNKSSLRPGQHLNLGPVQRSNSLAMT